ncbi:50S ribosomal protein L11 methyltransferase [Lactobacillus kullabergensis]|uniref:Ribosomal protein L11 methyltransferase n=1 Tax=Lactobacillus kullabergensis TaxID=1218493 RepID=A0ABN5LDA6_9LACO|nr:50S ribosomal protein L11 methyltransferase [Lactobacillus kullabergensis]AWM75389.1 50S ribosomal protein L11 methyltransferase [Lactobacillus kullabergensis]
MKLLIIKIETSHEVEDALNIYSHDVLKCLGTETRKRSDFEQAGWESDSTIVKLDEIKDLPEDLEFLAYFDMVQDQAELVKKYQKKLSELEGYGLKIGQAKVTASYIKDEDWNTVWQKFYHPIDFSRHLAIVPEWEEYQPAFKDQNIIKLDPGLAFGTGSHKTTQLALLGLEQILVKPETVCDVGTGSGILAIASSVLGASSVLATDISDEAITAANENISLNNLTNIKVQKTNLLNQVKSKYDIIVANILAEILLDLIPELNEHLNSNGKVIFSGIDCDQIEKIRTALTTNGFQIILSMQQGRWIGLIIERKDN